VVIKSIRLRGAIRRSGYGARDAVRVNLTLAFLLTLQLAQDKFLEEAVEVYLEQAEVPA
jgi:hypothetical protein